MQAHSLVSLITLLALAFYFWTSLQVGMGRSKYNVPAPAMTGAPEFERLVRVQMNTLESLPLFLPALWLFAIYWTDLIAAGLGIVWLAGRFVYAAAYAKDPATRSTGFSIQFLAIIVLWLGALVGVIMALAKGIV